MPSRVGPPSFGLFRGPNWAGSSTATINQAEHAHAPAWQTSILRRTRLKVVDEVANGLSYYDYTFLRELPRFYAELEDQLAKADPAWKTDLPSFLHMGSWIGGDRDRNPFVTAEVLHQALRMQSRRALSFYLDELHLMGGELSLDARLVGVSDELRELADRSPDRSPHREDEPYRRAISGTVPQRPFRRDLKPLYRAVSAP